MDTLYSWRARRAGGRITVTHSCGKVPNIDAIEVRNGEVIAVQAAGSASNSGPGREFRLHVPTGENPTAAALTRMDRPVQEG